VTFLGVALPFGVGVSRVYLGVHNPSDVLAGWLAGAIWLLCARRAFGRAQSRPAAATDPP
jgi:undecaprenyl-diphosphatase